MSADESDSKHAIQTSPASHGARAIGDILAALAGLPVDSQSQRSISGVVTSSDGKPLEE